MMFRAMIGAVIASILVCDWAGGALAQDNFFAGKTITLLAGLPPGGGVDGEMRVVAR